MEIMARREMGRAKSWALCAVRARQLHLGGRCSLCCSSSCVLQQQLCALKAQCRAHVEHIASAQRWAGDWLDGGEGLLKVSDDISDVFKAYGEADRTWLNAASDELLVGELSVGR